MSQSAPKPPSASPRKSPPARLHVLLARQSPLAVVIRRGPARQVCALLWDRTHDTFTVGQWLKGRIYEERCDISPDGKHWIYFALDGRWSSESRGSYTVVACPPYLSALAFYPQGDTWGGGGLFVDNRSTLRSRRPIRTPAKRPACNA